MLEVLMAFVLGVISVFSPCVLPVLPLIFAGSRGKAGDAALIVMGLTLSMVIIGFTASFVFNLFFRTLAMVFLLVFSFILLSEELDEKISVFASRLTSKAFLRVQSLPSFLFGMLLAFLWLPCILPFAGIALSQTLLSENPFVMVSYGFGMSVTIAAVLKMGERFILANYGKVKKIAGVVVLIYLAYFALSGVVW